MQKSWNIGIVGSGLIADIHAKAISEIDYAQTVGFCDNGSGRSKKLALKYHAKPFENYKKLIHDESVDMIIIASPSGAHLEPALEAAKAGKHVLCEKPLEITPERIDQMIEAHQKAGTYLGGIFNFRYDAVIPLLKDTIEKGRFGTITFSGVYVPWWRNDSYYADNWHGTKTLDGGGALMNQSIHMIDLLQYLMGPIQDIKSFIAREGHPEIEVEDIGVASCRFKNGALGLIYGTTASFPGQHRKLEISGTKGTVQMIEDSITVWQFADHQKHDEQVLEKYGKIAGGGGVSDPGAIAYSGHKMNIEDFLMAIDNKKPFAIDGEEAKKSVSIIHRIYENAGEIKK